MKISKLTWLLALPYVVVKTVDYPQWQVQYADLPVISCSEKEVCDDLAAALNEAHEKRKPRKPELSDKSKEMKEQFDYKSACGQDDCGAEPK